MQQNLQDGVAINRVLYGVPQKNKRGAHAARYRGGKRRAEVAQGRGRGALSRFRASSSLELFVRTPTGNFEVRTGANRPPAQTQTLTETRPFHGLVSKRTSDRLWESGFFVLGVQNRNTVRTSARMSCTRIIITDAAP